MGWLSGIIDTIRARWGPGRPEAPPPGQLATIDALIERMRAIEASLAPTDGVAAFNRMYLRVTELVRDRLDTGAFTNPAFMARLDVVFAGLYLSTIDAVRPTAAWAPVFELRHAPDRLQIQFALAGMNAHINHDLPIAVVRTCRQLGLTPDSRGVEQDYQRITGVLGEVQQEVRQSYFDGVVLAADEVASPVTDLVGAWSIGRARDAAWTNARVLWELDGAHPLDDEFLATLSRSVGLAGRFLLSPVHAL